MKKSTINPILGFSIIGYFIISQIMTIVYWIEYSNQHEFWETVFLGFFVAEFKGIFWILFIW